MVPQKKRDDEKSHSRSNIITVNSKIPINKKSCFTAYLVLQFIFIVILFTLLPYQSVFSDIPILTFDYSLHFYHAKLFAKMMSDYTAAWAYDASFLAGYPACIMLDSSNKLIEVMVYILNGLGISLGWAFNLSILLTFVLIPLILWRTAENLRLSLWGSISLMTIGICFWFIDDISAQFVHYGMYAFVFASFLSLLILSQYLSMWEKFSFTRLFFCTFTLTLGLLLHFLTLILVGLPLFVFFLIHASRMERRTLIATICSGVSALLLNSWWYGNIYEFWQHVDAYRLFWQTQPPVTLTIAYIVLGLAGIVSIRRERRDLFWLLLFMIVYYFVIACGPAYSSFLGSIQSARFHLPARLFCVLGFSLFVGIVLDKLSSYIKKDVLMVCMITTSTLALVLYLGLTDKPYRVLKYAGKELSVYADLLNFVMKNTNNSGRIAVTERRHILTGTAIWSHIDRQFIGGPFPDVLMKQGYANCNDKKIGRMSWTEDDRNNILNEMLLLNIKWIISYEPATNEKLDLMAPEVRRLATFPVEGPFKTAHVYEVMKPSGWFLEGSGNLQATINRICISNASAGGVVIRYHWMETLKCVPDLPMERYPIANTPVSFIRVVNDKTTDFCIVNEY